MNAEFDRHLKLNGAYNIRDLGGYPTRDGKRVATGRVFRGAELCTVDPAIAAHLADEVGIRRVIDLRMDDEALRGSPAVPTPCERLHLPLFASVLPQWATPTDRTAPSSARRYLEMAGLKPKAQE